MTFFQGSALISFCFGEDGITQGNRLQKGIVDRCQETHWLSGKSYLIPFLKANRWCVNRQQSLFSEISKHQAQCKHRHKAADINFKLFSSTISNKKRKSINDCQLKGDRFSHCKTSWKSDPDFTFKGAEAGQYKGYKPSQEPIWQCPFNANDVKAFPDGAAPANSLLPFLMHSQLKRSLLDPRKPISFGLFWNLDVLSGVVNLNFSDKERCGNKAPTLRSAIQEHLFSQM